MRWLQPIASVAVAVTMVACASPVYVGDPNALLGKTEYDVVRVYGRNFMAATPDDPDLVDGKVMVYRMRSFQDIMMYGNPYAPLVRSDCTLIFTLEAGRVKYTTARGTSCR